jgi:hypothetical protein
MRAKEVPGILHSGAVHENSAHKTCPCIAQILSGFSCVDLGQTSGGRLANRLLSCTLAFYSLTRKHTLIPRRSRPDTRQPEPEKRRAEVPPDYHCS